MNRSTRLVACLTALVGTLFLHAAPDAQTPSPSLFQAMRWRAIGPYRGGRTKAAEGVRQRPNVFYIGVVNGGVWKTTDYGRTWAPIFDDQPTGSIGAIAVAPSNPEVIYVGSGEGMQRPDLSTGDGIYKSTDAGATWTHLGLRDGQQIPQIIVDPGNPDRLFVAVLGHPYGPNEERGIFRSTDGGQSFQKVLYRDENTGGADIAFDPSNPNTVYAALWESRQGPWENGVFTGPGSGLFKSTDGGSTWQQLREGLPTFEQDGLGRIGITVAPSDPARLYATVEAGSKSGIYRSDDSGEHWSRVNDDSRVVARPNDAAEVRVHPTNPDIVFVPTIVTWKSTDGGRTFTGIRGAPGGDDYQRIWINPSNPDIMILSADQGAIVTVNGGASWSSWYNQPTAQFYHVSTDNAFPYRVCGGQQESGSACVSSRGHDGRITFRDWHPVGVEEYGYVAADPLDPDIVYGGKLTRFDRRTGQVQNVAPRLLRDADYRVVRTMPVLFSPVNPKLLYFASNVVWQTLNGGRDWQQISPDLTRETWDVPQNVGKYRDSPAARPSRRGVVYTLAPSSLDLLTIWAGSDDGLIHVTRDGGKTWRNVTPPDLQPWAKVSLMDASHADPLTAYAAINTLRLDDLRPHIYRTRDGGKTWMHVTNGMPDGETVNAVREDPKRNGLLFAGTERAVYVSFDAGDHWQSLRLNMPATSIRDLVIKDDDLVVGTHGRGFWILDGITPLRQSGPDTLAKDAVLFEPPVAYRVRWNMNTDTPLPPDEPAGRNPSEGAILDYYLKDAAAGPVALEIVDATGKVVRRLSSDDPPEQPVEGRNIPDYWIRPAARVVSSAGAHRVAWDLRHEKPAVLSYSYPIAAVEGDTPQEPRGPWVMPGRYTVKLTVGGTTLEQPLTVRMDPRVRTPLPSLSEQHRLSLEITAGLRRSSDALDEIRRLRAAIKERRPAASSPVLALGLDAVDQKLAGLDGSNAGETNSLARMNGQLALLLDVLQDADAAPTTAGRRAVAAGQRALAAALQQWDAIKANDVAALNSHLVQAGLAALEVR